MGSSANWLFGNWGDLYKDRETVLALGQSLKVAIQGLYILFHSIVMYCTVNGS